MTKRKKEWHNTMTSEQDDDLQNGSGDEIVVPENGPSPDEMLPIPPPPQEHIAQTVAYNEKPDTMVRVKIGYFDKIDNRYLAYNLDDISQAWLVDASLLKFSSNEQFLKLSILGEQVVPYDWTKEIEALIPDVNQVRLALWSAGLIAKKELNFREVLSKTLLRGVVPIKGAK